MNGHTNAKARPRSVTRGSRADAQLEERMDFLVFRLAGAEYGVSLEHVQELCHDDVLRPLAGAPECVVGVATRGGTPVTVLDLRALLGQDCTDKDRLAEVVILKSGNLVSGFAVDCVVDVVGVAADKIQADAAQAPVVMGSTLLRDRRICLLDAEKLAGLHPGPVKRLAA